MSAIYLPEDVRSLLKGKTVVYVGDSVQRSMYKDLVLLFQDKRYLTDKELRKKGEECFMGDELLEGGCKGIMMNSIKYREVRKYLHDSQTKVLYFFITACFGEYIEMILTKLKTPDIIIMNSCLWDVHRYGTKEIQAYESNLFKLIKFVKKTHPASLFLWTTTPPVDLKSKGGFLRKPGTDEVKIFEVSRCNRIAKHVMREENMLLVELDAVFHHFTRHRASDGVHWNEKAHRRMTNMILETISRAMGKGVPRVMTNDNHFITSPSGFISPFQHEQRLSHSFSYPDFNAGRWQGRMNDGFDSMHERSMGGNYSFFESEEERMPRYMTPPGGRQAIEPPPLMRPPSGPGYRFGSTDPILFRDNRKRKSREEESPSWQQNAPKRQRYDSGRRMSDQESIARSPTVDTKVQDKKVEVDMVDKPTPQNNTEQKPVEDTAKNLGDMAVNDVKKVETSVNKVELEEKPKVAGEFVEVDSISEVNAVTEVIADEKPALPQPVSDVESFPERSVDLDEKENIPNINETNEEKMEIQEESIDLSNDQTWAIMDSSYCVEETAPTDEKMMSADITEASKTALNNEGVKEAVPNDEKMEAEVHITMEGPKTVADNDEKVAAEEKMPKEVHDAVQDSAMAANNDEKVNTIHVIQDTKEIAGDSTDTLQRMEGVSEAQVEESKPVVPSSTSLTILQAIMKSAGSKTAEEGVLTSSQETKDSGDLTERVYDIEDTKEGVSVAAVDSKKSKTIEDKSTSSGNVISAAEPSVSSTSFDLQSQPNLGSTHIESTEVVSDDVAKTGDKELEVNKSNGRLAESSASETVISRSDSKTIMSVSSDSNVVVPSDVKTTVSTVSDSKNTISTVSDLKTDISTTSDSKAYVPSDVKITVSAVSDSETNISTTSDSKAIVPSGANTTVSAVSDSKTNISTTSDSKTNVSSDVKTTLSAALDSKTTTSTTSDSKTIVSSDVKTTLSAVLDSKTTTSTTSDSKTIVSSDVKTTVSEVSDSKTSMSLSLDSKAIAPKTPKKAAPKIIYYDVEDIEATLDQSDEDMEPYDESIEALIDDDEGLLMDDKATKNVASKVMENRPDLREGDQSIRHEEESSRSNELIKNDVLSQDAQIRQDSSNEKANLSHVRTSTNVRTPTTDKLTTADNTDGRGIPAAQSESLPVSSSSESVRISKPEALPASLHVSTAECSSRNEKEVMGQTVSKSTEASVASSLQNSTPEAPKPMSSTATAIMKSVLSAKSPVVSSESVQKTTIPAMTTSSSPPKTTGFFGTSTALISMQRKLPCVPNPPSLDMKSPFYKPKPVPINTKVNPPSLVKPATFSSPKSANIGGQPTSSLTKSAFVASNQPIGAPMGGPGQVKANVGCELGKKNKAKKRRKKKAKDATDEGPAAKKPKMKVKKGKGKSKFKKAEISEGKKLEISDENKSEISDGKVVGISVGAKLEMSDGKNIEISDGKKLEVSEEKKLETSIGKKVKVLGKKKKLKTPEGKKKKKKMKKNKADKKSSPKKTEKGKKVSTPKKSKENVQTTVSIQTTASTATTVWMNNNSLPTSMNGTPQVEPAVTEPQKIAPVVLGANRTPKVRPRSLQFPNGNYTADPLQQTQMTPPANFSFTGYADQTAQYQQGFQNPQVYQASPSSMFVATGLQRPQVAVVAQNTVQYQYPQYYMTQLNQNASVAGYYATNMQYTVQNNFSLTQNQAQVQYVDQSLGLNTGASEYNPNTDAKSKKEYAHLDWL